MNENQALKNIEKAVLESDFELAEKALECISDKKESLKALTRGLDAARSKLGDCSYSVAEFLLSVDVMRMGLKTIKEAERESKGRAVIGVVRGDVHDLGKNIVAGVMEACGYEVMDLGRDVSPEKFVEEAEKFNASILALSSMMSTPLKNMAKTIELARSRLPKIRIIAGGAALDEDVAKNLGAHDYAESAVLIPDMLNNSAQDDLNNDKKTRVFVDYDKKLRVEEIQRKKT